MKAKILPDRFFDRDARIVARELIGKYLVRRIQGKSVARKIIETEAYLGPQDLASHARYGKTKRNEVMFGPPGHWYIYFIYGIHYMLNVVTGPKGKPSAVLIRGVENVIGPGRLTKKLSINKRLNGFSLSPSSGLWVEERGGKVDPQRIRRTARIGIPYAGTWIHKPYRYILLSTPQGTR